MTVESISSVQQFHNIVRNTDNILIVIDFYATWCGPCQIIKPHFKELSEKLQQTHPDQCQFYQVDVDACPDISNLCEINCMPTFHIYMNESRLENFSGASIEMISQKIHDNLLSS